MGDDVINWDKLAELLDEIGAEAFGDVLDVFVTEIGEGLETLMAAQTPRARLQAFHFLKGAALNLGLDTLAATCAQGERLADQGQDTDMLARQVAQLFPGVTAELARDWRSKLHLV
jgi:HPt (histidine-containing phosphotransfer) domain-containing protein